MFAKKSYVVDDEEEEELPDIPGPGEDFYSSYPGPSRILQAISSPVVEEPRRNVPEPSNSRDRSEASTSNGAGSTPPKSGNSIKTIVSESTAWAAALLGPSSSSRKKRSTDSDPASDVKRNKSGLKDEPKYSTVFSQVAPPISKAGSSPASSSSQANKNKLPLKKRPSTNEVAGPSGTGKQSSLPSNVQKHEKHKDKVAKKKKKHSSSKHDKQERHKDKDAEKRRRSSLPSDNGDQERHKDGKGTSKPHKHHKSKHHSKHHGTDRHSD